MTPDRSPARRRPTTRLLTAAAVLAALIAAMLALAGCSGSSAGADAAMDGGMAPEPAGAGGLGYEQASGADAGGAATTADPDQMVVVTGYVTVVVTDPIAASGTVATLVETQGGRISSRSQQAAGEGRSASASLTARIPADKVSVVLDALAELGTVEETQLDSVEVTAQARDLDARIEAMQLSVDRLTDLLARSGDLADIVQAEQVLTDRQSQLEQLQSERAALADQVALSTVTINLYTDAAVPDEPPTGFVTGLATGWKALVTFLTWLVGTLGVLLPWIALGGVLWLAATPLVRRARRRAAKRAATRAPAGRGPAISLLHEPAATAVPSAAQPPAPPAGPDTPTD